jgi:hypothetical protein
MHEEDFWKCCANYLDDIECRDQFQEYVETFYDLIYNSDYDDNYKNEINEINEHMEKHS